MGAITAKTETAAQAIVAALFFTNAYTVNTGLDSDRLPSPNIVCAAVDTGEEKPPQSGNQVIKLRVTLTNNPADTTEAIHNADFGIIEDAFRSDAIGATLSAQVDEFSVYDPPVSVHVGEATDGHNIQSWIELDLLACSMDIA